MSLSIFEDHGVPISKQECLAIIKGACGRVLTMVRDLSFVLQKSLDEVDPKLLETFSKLGIPISEQKRLAGVKDVAYDYVFDSESIATTFKKELAAQGIIFCSISEAVREYPDLVKKHLGSVVSHLGPDAVAAIHPVTLSLTRACAAGNQGWPDAYTSAMVCAGGILAGHSVRTLQVV